MPVPIWPMPLAAPMPLAPIPADAAGQSAAGTHCAAAAEQATARKGRAGHRYRAAKDRGLQSFANSLGHGPAPLR